MSDNKVLSVAEIMAVDDLERKEVQVPEWGGTVVVREITKAEMNDLRRAAAHSSEEDSGPFEQALFLAGVEEPVFTPDQHNLLMQKSNKAIQRIMNAIMELSAMQDEGDQEALEKEVGSFPA